MAKDIMRFSKEGSQIIQKTFEKSLVPILDELRDVEKLVAAIDEWWKGDSAEEFIKLTAKAKNKIVTELEGWTEANKQLMREIEDIEFTGEKLLSSNIGNYHF